MPKSGLMAALMLLAASSAASAQDAFYLDLSGQCRDAAAGNGAHGTFVPGAVIEAANPKGELFGFECTRGISAKSAKQIAEAARAWGQNDDITVVTVMRARS